MIQVARLPIARRPYEEICNRHDLGTMNIRCSNCSAFHWAGEYVRTIRGKSFGMCCNHGKVRVPVAPDPPPLLRQLLDGTHADSRHFREHIRQYNAALAFTSLGVRVDGTVNSGRGPYVFRIGGELCHLIGSLLPTQSAQPTYAQLYIYDPRTALDTRMQRNSELNPNTMAALQDMLRERHCYAPIFRHAYEVLAGHPDPDMVSVRLVVDKNKDQRRYNLPGRHVDEVAVILPGDGSQPVEGRDIVLRYRDGALARISERHPAYACLHYVLIWWNGTNGWHEELRQHDPSRRIPRRLSQERFYAHQLFERPDSFNIIVHSGRLFQQYVVDVWAAVEQNRVNYLRFNQDQIRASLYSGLQDHVHLQDEVDLNNLGQRIVLPSSFTGSPRYMQQKFQDAMAIARFFKKIGIFATMTANPNWPEILRVLKEGEAPADRPDVVSRVFQLKKKAFMEDLIKRGVLGHVVAHIHTIEFQKRGLPHMHLLIFFADRDQLHEPADVDRCIRAYWPDPETEPELFETVKRCMVHGPCGSYDPGAPCMENGKCAKGFPKAFQQHTYMDREGYPLYHRPDDGRTYEVRGHMLDNRWIVPYNPYLLHRFDCHINVETSVTFHSVKYITKYIHKGPDRATLEVTDRDEIKRFIDSRYVSAPEAVWRLLEFDLHAHFPTVIRLQVSTFANVSILS
jgi:hypothetical protein